MANNTSPALPSWVMCCLCDVLFAMSVALTRERWQLEMSGIVPLPLSGML